ncbi:AAA family ATPase [Paralimibaculum aggregatum]|uniref:AAA family ATPase n=1 Tax=Paralimibaculum aggregatum TaxID=3036245 RepID=A0ABQ6LI19_9RHOB|nr:AAA family ATPase [Limibaculum sp. NKW23]GMG82937.1 AAA family ATPase [Limibaculum sp. NKW23]
MALSIRRDSSLGSAPEALVFADGFPEIDTLAEELDNEFGVDQWVEVSNTSADQALAQLGGNTSIAIVTASADMPQAIEGIAALIRKARDAGLLVLLIVGEISSRSMHMLLKEGVADFAPYPEPEGALTEAIERLRFVRASGNQSGVGLTTSALQRRGKVLTVYGVAGGVGASTIAVNLAWELATLVRKQGRKVALLDFNFQYGSVATFLDVPRREAVYELVSEASSFDQTGLAQALSTYQDKLWVLTAPRDALPLDIVTPTDVKAIINLAREAFDYVIIDMPQALMNWSEPVYTISDDFFAVMEIDMRSAQNMFRFLRTLKAESMDLAKLVFVLNRSPGMTDLTGKARVKRVAESLGITLGHQIPDGGKAVVNACDQGIPLAEIAKSNPVRKEVLRIAQRVATEDATKAASSG